MESLDNSTISSQLTITNEKTVKENRSQKEWAIINTTVAVVRGISVRKTITFVSMTAKATKADAAVDMEKPDITQTALEVTKLETRHKIGMQPDKTR